MFTQRQHVLRIQIQAGFNSKKREISTAEEAKIQTFRSKISIYIFLDFHEGLLSSRRSIQPSKENIQLLEHNFSFFFVSLIAFQDPATDAMEYCSGSTSLKI
jgi:hypothetical protein